MERLVNFRDIGGISTKDGRRIKKKKLLRSGELTNIGKQDAETLVKDYNLRLIIDFRDDEELLTRPDDIIEGVGYSHIDIMKDLTETATTRENLMKNFSIVKADDRMKGIYESIIMNQISCMAYQKFLRVLIEQKEGASLFHCFAGKDRTGIGAAIILTLLGASEEDIYQDYMKTNEQREAANQRMLEEARRDGFDKDHVDGIYCLMRVKETYLKQAFETVKKQYQSFDGYIRNGLNISEEEIEQLRQIYLE